MLGVLNRAGVVLGVTYPHRLVEDLEAARAMSIADVVTVRQAAGSRGFIDPKYGRDMAVRLVRNRKHSVREIKNGAMTCGPHIKLRRVISVRQTNSR